MFGRNARRGPSAAGALTWYLLPAFTRGTQVTPGLPVRVARVHSENPQLQQADHLLS